MEPLATLPVFFKLKDKRAVLAGGSEPAAWKAELLAAAGAHVDVYAEAFDEAFTALAEDPPAGRVTLITRRWQADDLRGAAIAIGAITDDIEAAAFVEAAGVAGCPVNVVDRPAYCAFQFGAIVNRSPLIVAISTDGAAPVFGQNIRSAIETLLPAGFKRWAEAAKAWRPEGDRLGASMAERRRFWERFSERAMRNAERNPTNRDLEALIAENEPSGRDASKQGFVTLVGAGPGDPELLTLRAVRALRAADVILYDDLVTAPVLEFARREAQRILVGKTGYGPACQQTEITAMMIRFAFEGKRVVRLKSGDPMIFGRGGEEMDGLDAAGIDFEVIPGISAAQAGAARLKVSLTHRDHAKRLQFIAGHARDGKLPANLDWQALADPGATTAVYMAHRTLAELRDRLTAAGLPPETPAAALIAVSRPDERLIVSSLDALPEALAASAIDGPCLVLIGHAIGAAAARQKRDAAKA
jgi:uroporphyrin-III C-methyltransferase / precorrin-2 dehydrogenase / sirohydrochlorin ferrochelatase